MAWSQAEVDTLKAAVASGILTVSFDGPPRRTITYQSLAEMRNLLAEMQGSVIATTGSSGGSGLTRFVSTRKGL